MKILLLNTTHLSLDDRVFFHQAISLKNKGYDIEITSTCEELIDNIDGITINSYDHRKLNHKEKALQLGSYIKNSKADIIIADSPRSVIAASGYNIKNNIRVIYDITEWYPSKKYLHDVRGLKKVMKVAIQILYNLYAAIRTDYFIFGERDKSIPFRILFPFKPFIYLPYYPNNKYIKEYPFTGIEKDFKLSYSGLMTKEKGLFSVIEAIRKAAILRADIKFHLQLTGKFPNKNDQVNYERTIATLPKNINVIYKDFQPFKDYCSSIGDTHLFFDLRKIDFENNRCLPIKLFYYFACGRPMIYSDLQAIQKSVPEINFGYLVNPENTDLISQHIINYINNPDLYKLHCRNSQNMSKKYNWECIESELVDLISKVESDNC